MTFGANDRGAHTIEIITIFVDNINLGTLKGFTDSISDCGEAINITKELSIGQHTYKAEIGYSTGNTSPMIEIVGEFTISENECKKIFLNRLVN